MSYRYVSEEDQEQIDWARAHNVKIPRYRVTATGADGEQYQRESEFTPAQFRRFTAVGFPECCSARNCAILIDLWNKEGHKSGCHYELI